MFLKGESVFLRGALDRGLFPRKHMGSLRKIPAKGYVLIRAVRLRLMVEGDPRRWVVAGGDLPRWSAMADVTSSPESIEKHATDHYSLNR